ncbi:hypothetical protein HDV01_005698 [Terramyces sp. JEL0728]|nr:hypothetical protein HDV01_005698 [Terramyces sp. JEL0728]
MLERTTTVKTSNQDLSKAATETVTDTAKIFDKSWEQVQKKTFTNWINIHLKECGAPPIVDLTTDLSNGENLILLLQVIGDESLGKFNRNPRIRLQKIENQNKALEFIKKRGDIVDSNEKLILGLIWTIILRFSIAEISEEGLTAKEGLLLWCQRRTAPYEADFKISNFTSSWMDGLALCALIHRHRPDLLNYWALDKKQKHANTQLAFDIAEKHLGIPKLFAVEDVVDVIRPDERSVMTYVAQYFHAFSALDKFGVAGRRVGALGLLLQNVWDMQNDYEKRATALIDALAQIQGTWVNPQFSGYLDARTQLLEFEKYKGTKKRGWVTERRDLDSLLGNIQTKLKTYNLRSYAPPAHLTKDQLDSHWTALVLSEASRKRTLTNYIRDAKDALRRKFADAASQIQEALNNISLQLASLDGGLETQLLVTKKLQSQITPFGEQLSELTGLDSQLIEANIEDNEYTIYSVEDLSFEYELVAQSLVKKTAFIENQIIARSKTNFTPQQLEQYSETFRIFDKDNSNGLIREEFKAALQAEGTVLDQNEFENTFLKTSQGSNEINFEQFIEYARSLEEDKLTQDHLFVAFKALAGDKDFVTEADFYRGGLTPQVVEYLKTQLPKKAEGYDYSSFISYRTKFKKPDIHLFLKENVEGLGKAGDIVLANLGYARNYLVPFKKAYYVPRHRGIPILPDNWVPPLKETADVLENITPAVVTVPYNINSIQTANPIEQIEHIMSDIELKDAVLKIQSLDFQRVRIKKDSDKIFGSVTPTDIANSLLNLNINIDKEKIQGRFKEIGEHQATISISEDIDPISIKIIIKDIE